MGSVIRRWLGLALIAAAAVFLFLAIRGNWQQIVSYDWHIRPAEIVLSLVVLLAALVWGVHVWGRVLGRFSHPPVGLGMLLRIWFLSNLARYIPGKIWQFVGAAELARRAGLSASVLLTSMVVHAGIALVSAALVSLLALPVVSDQLGMVGTAAVLCCGLFGFGLVHPAVLNRGLRLVPRRLHQPMLSWTGCWRDGLVLLLMGMVAWVLYGAAFALFVDALVGIPLAVAPALVAANALAFLAGYLVFVTPGGLGAREAALALLLEPLGFVAVAAVVAVASRLWLIVGELIGATLSAVLVRPGPPHLAEAELRSGESRMA